VRKGVISSCQQVAENLEWWWRAVSSCLAQHPVHSDIFCGRMLWKSNVTQISGNRKCDDCRLRWCQIFLKETAPEFSQL
jgi:hypothetical protein